MYDRTTSWSPSGGGDPAPRECRMPAVGETLAGRFRLRRILGAGSSGVVFAARDIRLNQPVAIKVLHPGRIDTRSLERLRREVQAARGGHPHVAGVYDLHEADGLHFLSMELVEGESLRDRLRRERRLPLDETIRIGAQVASALAHLHARGIVHRDVKPGNILLTGSGDAKLCDMGLARPVEQGMTVTETAMVVGTPAYMAPEQATGKELTPATDIYALGITLYQALSGTPPLVEATALSTLVRRQKERPAPLGRGRPEVPRWLGRLVDRMLDPHPGERPTAAQVERALRAGRFRFRPRRRTVVAGAVLAAAAVAVPVIHSQIRRGETVRFEVAGESVTGVDSGGRTTWTRPMGSKAAGTVRADLNGDGTQELAVVTRDDEDLCARQRHVSRLAVFDLRGRVLVSARLRDVIQRWSYPYPLQLDADLMASDLDRDGRSELVILCRQSHFFPSEILVYWPEKERWQVVLEHPGYIRNLVAAPDAHHPVLHFAGLANRPIYAPVAGTIVLHPSELSPSTTDPGLRLRHGARSAPGAFLEWYTFLDPDNTELLQRASKLLVDEDGGTIIRGSETGTGFSLDRFGNPEASPNLGRDLRDLRCQFLAELNRLKDYTDAGNAESVQRTARQLRIRLAPLLAERPYRIAMDVVEARSLARVGGLHEAVVLLERTVRDTHNDDALCRLSNLLAVAGRLRDAVDLLAPAVATPHSQRANFDGRVLLFKLAVELRDRPLAERSLFHFGVRSLEIQWGEGTVAAILARAHLWWDQLSETDCTVRSWSFEPAGGALACLARWRLGRSAGDDPRLMREGALRNPDALCEFRLAEAAAQLGLGHPEAALLVLDHLEPGLRTEATEEFASHQLLHLAHALHAKALLDAHEPAKARTEAAAVLPTLTPGLLPAKLAGEVLEATGSPTAPSHP